MSKQLDPFRQQDQINIRSCQLIKLRNNAFSGLLHKNPEAANLVLETKIKAVEAQKSSQTSLRNLCDLHNQQQQH